ncbi:MAG: beta-propeller domain-containing protein, partial [Actinobacteria bacterium]|nr:beta-propeller domain-containing protein [Actinomycetota bacterium]
PWASTVAANKVRVASSRVSAWLPTYKIGRHAARVAVNCRDVLRPVNFSGLGLLTVLTLDLSQGLTPVDSTAVMTDGRIVYASPTTLYVATEGWYARPLPDSPESAPSGASTLISAFDISDPTKTTYLGSGTVPGYLLNQWSMSEFQGVLRVVSTDTPAWWGSGADSQSYLTTLRPSGGALTQVGQVGGLGQGDRVYAVRMIGDTGYVVTFRQVDPLYTIDLHDPANPAVLGQLDLPGYSSYLHPISDTLLLGIGQNVDPSTNEPSGTQVTLFDVSDLKNPKRVQTYSLGQGWSSAESDHHAFLYWPATNLVVVPFGQQAVALKVSASGISELGRIVQTQANSSSLPEIERSAVVRNALLTVSSAGVASNALSDLASLGWAQFPVATPTPVPLPGPIVGGVVTGKAVGTGIAVSR